MLGVVPSDVLAYIDFKRLSELVVDDNEVPPITPDALNNHLKAKQLVNSAQGTLVQACRRGQYYSLRQLRDLVRNAHLADDPGQDPGQQIMSIIADIVWCRAIGRKRYPKGTPQGDDVAYDRYTMQLDQLRRGERVFVLEGVEETDDAGNVIGVYTDTIPAAGILTGGQLVADTNAATRLWGCNLDRPSGAGSNKSF
jgi:hypothetical protein